MSVALPSGYRPSRRVRAVALLVGLAAGAAAVAGGVALAHGHARGQTTALALATIAAGCTFAAGGIIAWLRRPENPTGLLMMATGFLLFGASLAQAGQALPYTVGLVLAATPGAVVAYLLLAFPDGRLHSTWERVVIAVAVLDVTVGQVTMLMFMGPEHMSGCPCPDNLLLIRADDRVHSPLMSGLRVTGVLLTVAVGVLVANRVRAASPPLRRAITPLLSAGALTVVLLGASLVAPSSGVSYGLQVAERIALATVPIAYLLGLFNARLFRAGVSDLVVELGRMPEPGRLRDALARALGDPSLELAYWIPDSASYVGIDGRPVDVHAGDGRAVTVLDRQGRRVAALVHDEALTENQELLDAVSSAAGLALENERLQADLRAQLDELRDSRARIVEACDTARRRLERNLHDGAQQRFVALSVALGLAERKLQTDPEAAAALLSTARDELAVGLDELRELARGLHPAILGRGLEVALAGIAERAPVPVDVQVDAPEPQPEQVEAAAYYVVAEALTNVARYAGATHASVRVSCADDHLDVVVRDDGVGGAEISPGSGLEGLRDRVEAIGGRLEIDSPAGEGTRIAARLPLRDD